MSVTQFVRGKVSKSKRRYVDKEGGYDLDLSCRRNLDYFVLCINLLTLVYRYCR